VTQNLAETYRGWSVVSTEVRQVQDHCRHCSHCRRGFPDRLHTHHLHCQCPGCVHHWHETGQWWNYNHRNKFHNFLIFLHKINAFWCLWYSLHIVSTLAAVVSSHFTVIRVIAHLWKSNSRTFQGLSRTIRRIYKENYIKANRHFYKHKQAKRPPQIQPGSLGEHCKLPPLTHFCGIRANETHLVIAITCSVTAF